MMLSNPWHWETEPSYGKGDALWRTGIAYIVFKEQDLDNHLLSGIKSCYVKIEKPNGDYYYQVYRYPFYRNDVSRDQIIMSLAALKINGDDDLAKEYSSHLRFRLSKKFIQTPEFYFWNKTLYKEQKFYSWMFLLYSFIYLSLVIPVLKFCNWAGNIKTYSINDFKSKDRKELSLRQKIFLGLRSISPNYYIFLYAVMLYTIPVKNRFHSYVCSILLNYVEDDNWVVRYFLGESIPSNINYRTMKRFRWNKRLDDSISDLYVASVKDERYNNIDGGLLKWCKKIKK